MSGVPTKMEVDLMIQTIEYSAKEVFDVLGSGQTETVYENALEVELTRRGIEGIRRQVPHPIYYKGNCVGTGIIDLMIGHRYLIELKAVAKLNSKDEAQLKKYFTTYYQKGLIINFNFSSGELEVVQIAAPSQTN